jgi:transcriptional regulator with XRE-family HTH domain
MLESSSLIAYGCGMTGKKMDLGPTGEHTRQRVKQLREQRRMSYAELSRILDELGRPIPPLGLRRIEAGERRVDVDDLTALAVALKVSPIGLLMPATAEADEAVTMTGSGEPARADTVWNWLSALEPLPGVPKGCRTNWAELRGASWPRWRWDEFNAGDELQKRKKRFDAKLAATTGEDR